MVTNLLVPDRRIVVPKPPSYLKLDMAFAIGAGAKLMDKSRYRSHGTITGATWADGAHGRCLDFVPGTPSYVEIAAAYDQLNFTSEDFSIVARVKVDSFGGVDRMIFSRGRGITDGYEFYAYKNGFLTFHTYQGGVQQVSYGTNGDIVVDTWYTVGISRSRADAVIYMNGIDATLISGVHIDPLTSTRTAKIGVNYSLTGKPFDGKMEFLRVFGANLSASENLAWHNALK